jgi:tetratricopeptide (TPR) repeat protein
VGLKDPKWDVQAREALRLISLVWSETRTTEVNPELLAYNLCTEAARAGCEDPLVMYVRAWCYNVAVRKDYMEALRQHLHAARLMKEKGSKYPPIRQAFVFVRAAEFFARLRKETPENDRQAIKDLLEPALARFGEAARDAEVPDSVLMECGNVIASAWMYLDKDRKIGIDQVAGVFSKARPDGTLPLLFIGSAYFKYAWDARGNGWASTVTAEGWKLMGERLLEAEAALIKVWERNPDDPQAPTLMIGVELGQGRGMDVMEKWFKRAMFADPDNLDACRKKMYYLEPKWHGSAEHMLEFGRALLAGGNWDARLPFQLIDAHLTLAGYASNRAAYYKDEGVWKDVKAVYETYLKGHPDSPMERSWFAKLACWCGHFDVAHSQFQELGDKAVVTVFENRAGLDRLRAEAADKGR